MGSGGGGSDGGIDVGDGYIGSLQIEIRTIEERKGKEPTFWGIGPVRELLGRLARARPDPDEAVALAALQGAHPDVWAEQRDAVMESIHSRENLLKQPLPPTRPPPPTRNCSG